MSFFDQNVVFSAQTSMPGVGISPSAPGSMGLNGPNVPYIQWAPLGSDGRDQINPVRNFTRGGVPTTVHIHSQLPSNDFIQSSFTAKPWLEDKAHLRIREGMIVFGTTELDPQIKDLNNIVSLPKLNTLLEKQFNLFEKHSSEPGGIPELVRYKGSLSNYNEKLIQGELKLRSLNYNERKESMDLVIRGLNQSVLRYQTMAGILNTWNFLGGVLSVPDATTGEDYFSFDGADKVLSLNVVMGKRIMMGNVWGGAHDGGNVDVGSHLWLILRRRERPNGTYGAYQFIPYASKWRAAPPMSQLMYKNPYTHTLEHGKALYVGIVTLGNRNDPAKGFRETAAGIGSNTSVNASYEAHAKIPMIEVQIGI